MNEGKELLIDVIKSYEEKLSDYEDIKVIINDIDVADTLQKLNDDHYYLAYIPTEFVEQVIIKNNYQKHILFKRKINQLINLYLGQREYGINVKEKDDHIKTINKFKELLSNLIDDTNNKALKEHQDRLNAIMDGIKYNEIINDYTFIEYIVKAFDEINFDKNMYTVMKYVTKHNYNILNDKNVIDVVVKSNELQISDIDPEVKDILTKLYISYNDLPIDFKLILKDTSIDDIKDVYELIKHNKVEEYGVLHLIDRNNYKAKLALLLFSSVKAIKENIDAFKDNNDELNIKSIKIMMNTLINTFVVKDNSLYKPLHYNFLNNIESFKVINVDTNILLKKCPLLFTISNEQLLNIFDHFKKYNVDKKKIINKCYKTLSYNPSLLLDNFNYLFKNKMIDEYLQGDNYNLLKVVNLDKKIDYIKNKYNIDDLTKINSYMIKEIYDNSDKYLWGDEDA